MSITSSRWFGINDVVAGERQMYILRFTLPHPEDVIAQPPYTAFLDTRYPTALGQRFKRVCKGKRQVEEKKRFQEEARVWNRTDFEGSFGRQ